MTRLTHLENLRRKIYTIDTIQPLLSIWRFKDEKIVFSNGCFDILHRGHIEYLSKAADLGKHLIIGLNSDASVRGLKGESRPLQDEQSRLTLLSALQFVDAVILFDEPTPYELIKAVMPDYLVKGKDYEVENVVGYDIVIENGGEVKTIDLVPGYSTTSIIEKALSH